MSEPVVLDRGPAPADAGSVGCHPVPLSTSARGASRVGTRATNILFLFTCPSRWIKYRSGTRSQFSPSGLSKTEFVHEDSSERPDTQSLPQSRSLPADRSESCWRHTWRSGRRRASRRSPIVGSIRLSSGSRCAGIERDGPRIIGKSRPARSIGRTINRIRARREGPRTDQVLPHPFEGGIQLRHLRPSLASAAL